MKQIVLERGGGGACALVLPDAFTRALALRLSALVGTARRVRAARATRHALGGLSDRSLKDIGLVRGQIEFVADAVARGHAVRLRGRAS